MGSKDGNYPWGPFLYIRMYLSLRYFSSLMLAASIRHVENCTFLGFIGILERNSEVELSYQLWVFQGHSMQF